MANQRRARYSVADDLRQILEDESDSESLSDPSDDSYMPDQAAVRDTSDEDQVSDIDEQPDEISADSGHSYNQFDNENAQQGQAIAERPHGRGRKYLKQLAYGLTNDWIDLTLRMFMFSSRL